MRKLVLSVFLGLILMFSVSLMANVGELSTAIPSEDIQEFVSSGTRAPCTMVKHNGSVLSYWGGYQDDIGTYTYYNPAVECAAPTYPFEITAFSFTLYDDGNAIVVWPVYIDIVVYYPTTPYDSCSGPGVEVCRYSMTADSLTYAYPNMGTYTLPIGCCVYAPFFMGVEYTSGAAGTVPSVIFDNNAAPDTCDIWMLNTDGSYYEWFNFWSPPPPGYPMFEVGGETVSGNCDVCDWQPDDPHKMHFPQLPNPMGWDVNATAPLVLADDWMCSETGWVKDIHWWGSWMHGIEGQVIYFVLSIHSDIPADPPMIPYSHPGITLWEFEVSAEGVPPVDPPGPEGWYDPMTGQFYIDDHMAYFQYNVCLDSLDWFWQDQGTIYWLNISAVVADPSETQWGWKSTLDHWNDDAVWAEWGELFWIDMWEPPDFTTSLDLSFVITGGVEEPIGACCWQDPPAPDWFCVVTTEDSCLNFYNGVYETDGTSCQGMEACCLLDGSCVMADALCCVNELGGTPQGAGTACTALEACCFADGSCTMLDPVCCDDQGGTPQGTGTVCTAAEACCFASGLCADMDPLCCIDQNGAPQGPGTICSGVTVACCLPGGGCMDIEALCCDDMGGWVSPLSAVCLGDINANGIDDACDIPTGACCLDDNSCQQLTQADCNAITGAAYLGDGTLCRGDSDGDGFDDACVDPWPTHKMHFPQLPDPTGWDVMATQPIVLADDWMCMESGPVTDIHWWGSWLDDNIGTVDYFVLSIHEDIPADPPLIPYSRPGTTLWEYEVYDFDVIAYDPPTMEGWYDPSVENALFDNHVAYFRYDVYLPEHLWFVQEQGTIYWLNISAVGVGPTGSEQWGWKSSQDRWNDDAVWAFWSELNWIEMYEPAQWKYNAFGAQMGNANILIDGFGENAYGEGWYFYESGWWNVWFYDDPFVYGKKEILVNGMATPTDAEAYLIFAVNWSTDIWSLEGNPPGDRRPPLPGDLPEDAYIGRATLFDGPIYEPTPLEYYYEILDYNPEWVSIDIMGQFFAFDGVIAHKCRPSLNLAFVITSELSCQGICGDANNDGTVNVSDAVYIINYVFVGGGEPQPVLACGDANSDGTVNVSDAVWIINYVFVGGGPPGDCAPGSPNWYNGDCCPWAGQK